MTIFNNFPIGKAPPEYTGLKYKSPDKHPARIVMARLEIILYILKGFYGKDGKTELQLKSF